MEDIISKIREIVEKELDCSAHGMDHINRVYNLALHLAKTEENVDLEILKISSLLHDIARYSEMKDASGNTCHAIVGAEMSKKILIKLNYPENRIEKILHCILAHRYRSAVKAETIEAKLLFDADKIDALGAVGVGRSFVSAGQYGSKMYSDITVKEYIKENHVDGKINGRIMDLKKHTPKMEFETKFKFIPERLYTNQAKEFANKRLKFMSEFFKELEKEVKGEN